MPANLSNDNIISALRPGLKTGIWILEVWSENWCGKLHVLFWNRVRIWTTGRHTPTNARIRSSTTRVKFSSRGEWDQEWDTVELPVTARSDPGPFYTACDVISLNGQGQLCPGKTCAGWRDLSNHTRINGYDSVKETGEQGKKLACNIDPKISMKTAQWALSI